MIQIAANIQYYFQKKITDIAFITDKGKLHCISFIWRLLEIFHEVHNRIKLTYIPTIL